MKFQIKRESVNYSNLSHNGFVSVVKSALNTAIAEGIADTHIVGECAKPITANLEIIERILNEETRELSRSKYDLERDNDFTYTNTMLDAFAGSRDPIKSEAATSLLAVYDSFDRNLDDLPLDEETVELDKVLNVWGSEESKAHFTTLDLLNDLVRLQSSAAGFKQFSITRTEDKDTQSPKVRDLRNVLRKDFVMWLDIIKGLANLHQDEQCYKILRRINEVLKEQDALLKGKATRNTKDVSEDVELEG